MWRNYLNIAIRTMWKNRLFSSINISGLALGLAVAILITLYIRHETAVDQWLPEGERTYRIYRYWADTDGAWAYTPRPLSKTIVAELPEVEAASFMFSDSDILFTAGEIHHYVEHLAYVDSTFLEVLSIPLLYGDEHTALASPESVIISERIAQLLFGTAANAIGASINFNDEMQLSVTGVYANLNGRSHLRHDALMRLPYEMDGWLNFSFETYTKLTKASNPELVAKKIDQLVKPFLLQAYNEANFEVSEDEISHWGLQPFRQIYLNSGEINAITVSLGSARYVYIFGFIALLVLLIAGINYVNLSTARASGRVQEIGIRKVSGAERKHLIIQFLAESVLQSLLALLIALPLVQITLPIFSEITGRELAFMAKPEWPLLFSVLGGTVCLGLLAGTYPALILSGFKTSLILKGDNKTKRKGYNLRHVLVTTQFVGVVVLAIMMGVMYRQLNYMLQQDLGFNSEQIIQIPLNYDDSWRKLEARKSDWLEYEGIHSITTASALPGDRVGNITIEIEHSDGQYVSPDMINVSPGYDEVLGLKVLEGRFISDEHPGDTSLNFVVNEAFAEAYELKEPIVGQRIRFPWEENWGQIVGVVKNYHYNGLDHQIRPLVFSGRTRNRMHAAIKVDAAHWSTIASFITQQMRAIEPAHPFRHHFLDEHFAQQYVKYQQLSKTLRYSTLLTIIVAMLGVFGLAVFLSQQKIKEIGIRKVLGASELELVFMLLKRFILIVVAASIIALPIGWWLARKWLEDFAYQMKLDGTPFILAVLLALLVTSLTVCWQAYRAARINPVEALRYE